MRNSFQQLNIDKGPGADLRARPRPQDSGVWVADEKLSTFVCLVFLAPGLPATHPVVALAPGGTPSADSALLWLFIFI